MSYQQLENLPVYQTGQNCDGKSITTAGVANWFNSAPPPPIGACVLATFNRLGAGSVVGYFVEDDFLGLLVRLEDPPAWHVKQNGRDRKAHLFGTEFTPLDNAVDREESRKRPDAGLSR